jgi:hypothetical protein
MEEGHEPLAGQRRSEHLPCLWRESTRSRLPVVTQPRPAWPRARRSGNSSASTLTVWRVSSGDSMAQRLFQRSVPGMLAIAPLLSEVPTGKPDHCRDERRALRQVGQLRRGAFQGVIGHQAARPLFSVTLPTFGSCLLRPEVPRKGLTSLKTAVTSSRRLTTHTLPRPGCCHYRTRRPGKRSPCPSSGATSSQAWTRSTDPGSVRRSSTSAWIL